MINFMIVFEPKKRKNPIPEFIIQALNDSGLME